MAELQQRIEDTIREVEDRRERGIEYYDEPDNRQGAVAHAIAELVRAELDVVEHDKVRAIRGGIAPYITDRNIALEQRDDALDRAERAETELAAMRDRYDYRHDTDCPSKRWGEDGCRCSGKSGRALSRAERERTAYAEERDELRARINRAVNMCRRSPNNGRVQEICEELNPAPAYIDLSDLGTDVWRWSGIGWTRATVTECHDNGTVTVAENDGGEFTVSPDSLTPRKDTTDELVDGDSWTDHLARLLAHYRVGDAVYMDGSHHPHAGETHRARLHMRDMHHAGWRQLDENDDSLINPVANAIHDIHCGCDGSMHSGEFPRPYRPMSRAAIRALLNGGDQ